MRRLPCSPKNEVTGIVTARRGPFLVFATRLQHLKQLPALKKLVLGGVDITKDEVERLQRELPAVKVEWTVCPTEVYQKRIGAAVRQPVSRLAGYAFSFLGSFIVLTT